MSPKNLTERPYGSLKEESLFRAREMRCCYLDAADELSQKGKVAAVFRDDCISKLVSRARFIQKSTTTLLLNENLVYFFFTGWCKLSLQTLMVFTGYIEYRVIKF